MDFAFCLLLAAILGQAASATGQAVELWCVAKNNAEDSALQGALDWACSTGGANCGPVQVGGSCYDPADLERTSSFAFNDYFLKSGMTEDSCNFDGTAALSSLNPSHGNCKFPSSFTGRNRTAAGSQVVSDNLTSGTSVNDLPLFFLLFLLFTRICL
jgi:hypothetical protein